VAKPEPVRIFVEDLYWLRAVVKDCIRSGRLNPHALPKANRMHLLASDLCQEYDEAAGEQVYLRLIVQGRE
jgi:hypothetical protein